MQLIHTSPAPIDRITRDGRFGEFLFFSSSEYVMTAGAHVTYCTEVDEAELIDASSLFCHENAAALDALVARLAALYGVDIDTAESLLDESASIFDIECNVEAEDLADASWNIQRATARAAKLLGFRGVRVTDEQGGAYMVDMIGREAELIVKE